jgi:hypothetical protein
MDIKNATATTLKQIGKDEKWLQDWLTEDPQRLGIGNVAIKAKELRHYVGKGGRLDILAYNAAIDTYYEIEIMLGECDPDHGFRVLDYWARERLRHPNSRHVAVLVAEDLSGRYKTVIEALTQHLPLIAVELKTLQLGTEPPVATTFAVVFSQPDDLVLQPADEPERAEGLVPNDEETWRATRPEFTEAAKLMYKTYLEKVGPTTIDFSAKSYISLKKGKRAWFPMWPRQDGFYVYIPRGDGGSEDQPNDFFAHVKENLAELNIEPSWTFKYNAGANPIAFSIPKQHLNHSKIIDILKEAYDRA